jgi:hypothetical protein
MLLQGNLFSYPIPPLGSHASITFIYRLQS